MYHLFSQTCPCPINLYFVLIHVPLPVPLPIRVKLSCFRLLKIHFLYRKTGWAGSTKRRQDTQDEEKFGSSGKSVHVGFRAIPAEVFCLPASVYGLSLDKGIDFSER